MIGDVNAITIPATALLTDGRTSKVLVVQEGKIEERLVEIGEVKDGVVEIRRGVLKGDAVVVTPRNAASDGMRVVLAAKL